MDISIAVNNLIQSYPFVALTVLLLANVVLGALNALRPDPDGVRRFTALELTDICKKVVPFIGTYFALGTGGEVLQNGYGELLKAVGAVLPGIAFALGTLKNALGLVNIQVPSWLVWLYPQKVAVRGPNMG